MSISEKIKAINNKIEQNKAQYNLDRQTSKISGLSSGNVGKYETQATTMKRFEYWSLGKELKAQTDIAKKQYQKLGDTDWFVGIKKEKPIIKKYSRSNLIYNSKYNKYEYYNNKIFDSCSSLINEKIRF